MPPRATLRSPRRKAKGTGGRVGEKGSRPAPSKAPSADPQADPTAEVERALEGERQEGIGRSRISARGGTDAPVGVTLCSRGSPPSLSGEGKSDLNGTRAPGPERGADHRDGARP